MNAMLVLTHVLLWLATVLGLRHLSRPRSVPFWPFCATVAAAALAQVGWLAFAAGVYQYCALFDAWGMMAVVVLGAIGLAGVVSWHFRSVRILIGSVSVLAIAVVLGHLVFPAAPGPAPSKVDAPRAFHILLLVMGYATLILGCVAGAMFLQRSKALKNSLSDDQDVVPWPALTTLDRMYVYTSGWGLLQIASGIFLGVISSSGSGKPGGSWQTDVSVWLTISGFAAYLIVWVMRKRQGFCSRLVVGIGTVAFCFVLLGFFVSTLIARVHGV